MTQPRRQHWVPKFYLRGFAIPETAESKSPQAWVIHRQRGGVKSVGIHNLAVQRELYTLFAEDGTPDYSVERDFGRLETVVSDRLFWPRLCDDFVDFGSPSIRKVLSLFLATLFLRNPARKTDLAAYRQEIVNLIEAAPKDATGTPAVKSIVVGDRKVRFDKDGWEALRNLTDAGLHQQFIDWIHPQVGQVADSLIKKRWSMLFVDEPLFVTSTDPVFVIDPEMKPSHILGKGAKILCPISAKRMLCLDDLNEPGDRYYPLQDKKAVGFYTYFTWRNTTGYMISPRCIPVVLQEMLDFMDSEKKRQDSQH